MNMNHELVITGAVTGAGDAAGKHPDLPVTPRRIADAALDPELEIFDTGHYRLAQSMLLGGPDRAR